MFVVDSGLILIGFLLGNLSRRILDTFRGKSAQRASEIALHLGVSPAHIQLKVAVRYIGVGIGDCALVQVEDEDAEDSAREVGSWFASGFATRLRVKIVKFAYLKEGRMRDDKKS